MVRFIRSTCRLVQGWRRHRSLARQGRPAAAGRGGCNGLVSRCRVPGSAHAAAKAWQRKRMPAARIALMSLGVQPSPVGSVTCVPWSVSEPGAAGHASGGSLRRWRAPDRERLRPGVAGRRQRRPGLPCDGVRPRQAWTCGRLGRLLPAAASLTEQPPAAVDGDQEMEPTLRGLHQGRCRWGRSPSGRPRAFSS